MIDIHIVIDLVALASVFNDFNLNLDLGLTFAVALLSDKDNNKNQ